MVMEYKEEIKSDFDGTIIDLETIGDFNRGCEDSREYKDIIPVIFGAIDKNGIRIYCAKSKESINKLREKIKSILPELERPFHAFNSNFEEGSLFHQLGEHISFEKELNQEKFEPKWRAVASLKIPQYEDPFQDKGILCMKAWLSGDMEKAIAHNRSCLLKERDILLKRGHREPDKLKLIK